MLSEGRMRRASLRHRAFDPWPRAAQPWTTQDADAMRSGKTCAYLLKDAAVGADTHHMAHDPSIQNDIVRHHLSCYRIEG